MEGLKKEGTETGYTILLEDFLSMGESKRYEFRSEFCYQSNLIEGIKSPIHDVETMDVGEKYEWPPELKDHFSAFDFMLENFQQVLKEEDIKKMHFLLMHNLFKKPEKYAGKYRPYNVQVGGKGCPLYEHIPKLMKNLELDIFKVESQNAWQEDILNIHNKFETIHPFADGNGRTGRLILNWLSLKHLGMFNVVESEKRQKYYGGIRQYKEEFKKKNLKVEFCKDAELKPRKLGWDRDYVSKYFK